MPSSDVKNTNAETLMNEGGFEIDTGLITKWAAKQKAGSFPRRRREVGGSG